MLFVELALIRWTAAYDIHLAYLTNFVLLPPSAWGVIVVALLAVLVGLRPQLLALVAVVVVLAIQSAAPNDYWSPYYKVTTIRAAAQEVGGITAHDTLTISANNIPHQT